MIGYYLHHQGSGHRRRATAVARRTRHPVTGLGSGPAPEGWPGAWVELARDDHPAVDPEGADVTARDVLHWAPLHHEGLLRRHRQLLAWLELARPELLVVDVSVEVSLLARLCGVPVVVGGMPGRRTDAVHALAYDVAEAILAPWPPGAHPRPDWPDRWRDKTWEVGGISALADAPAGGDVPAPGPWVDTDPGLESSRDDAPAREPGATGGGRVLVLWGAGGDPLRPEQLEEARAATPGWTWEVRGGGHPSSPDLLADLAEADVVVCHAGQGAVADVALARRPAVVLAQPRPFDEQTATAEALARLGLAATGHGWPAAGRWPELLSHARGLGGQGWSRWGEDAAGVAAGHLDDLADSFAPATPARTTGETRSAGHRAQERWA
ncbi:glycosyltransferase [Serinicoccus sediminis]|uniref:glycosyltransferase n=1 Tax=Serinicoccus sediminis TaxID=2306021 RepID=UPI00101EF998|nr:glycosyltransferase [Serinicoccus sediminis]